MLNSRDPMGRPGTLKEPSTPYQTPQEQLTTLKNSVNIYLYGYYYYYWSALKAVMVKVWKLVVLRLVGSSCDYFDAIRS